MTTVLTLAQRRPAPLFLALALLAGGALGAMAWWVADPVLLVGGLVALAVLALTWSRPDLGLLVLVFITYTRLSDVLIEFHGAPSVAKAYVGLLLAVVAVRWLLYGERPGPWLRGVALLALYGLVGFASLLWAGDSGETMALLVDYGKDVLVAVLVIMLLRSPRDLRRVTWALLAAGIFLGTLTVVQALAGAYDNSFGGFAQAELRGIAGGARAHRAAGVVSSNYYALIMVALVPLAWDRWRHEARRPLRYLAGWGVAVTVLAVLLTYSRGGLLALGLVLIVQLWRFGPRLRPSVLLVALALALLAWQLLPPEYVTRVGALFDVGALQTDATRLEDSSLRQRVGEMTVAAQMFADQPFLGVGLANFNRSYLDYSEHLGLDPRRENRSAHSLYLEIAAETGLVGLLAFGLLLGGTFFGLWQGWLAFRSRRMVTHAGIVAALAIGLAGYLVGSIFLHLAFPRYLWLLIGIALAAPNAARAPRR